MSFCVSSTKVYGLYQPAAATVVQPSAPVEVDPRLQRTLVCYIPVGMDAGIVSCTQVRGGGKLVFTTDHRCAIVPAGAIIDSVEFFGYDNFGTKDVFSIGLGQLNTDITFPLVQNADSTIANEKMGGCRDFISCEPDGKNLKNIVVYDSHVNVDLGKPVTNGGLQIVVRYHMKQ